MNRCELRKALRVIADMPDADIALNREHIRRVCAEAAGMMGQDHAVIRRQRVRLKELKKK